MGWGEQAGEGKEERESDRSLPHGRSVRWHRGKEEDREGGWDGGEREKNLCQIRSSK